MKFSKGKGLLAVLALVVAFTPVAARNQVSASDTDGLSGIAKVLADATPSKTDNGIRSRAGIAGVLTNEDEPRKKSARITDMILNQELPDIDELIVQARKRAWENKAIVTVDEDEFVYMRSEPSTEGSILGIMPHGAAGIVIEEHGDWSYINSGTIDGFVSNEYLAFGEEALKIAEDMCGYVAYVKTYQANIRSGPSLDDEVLDTVSEGMYFEVISEDDGWVKIRFTKGQEAYMSKEVVDVFLATGVAVHLDEENKKDEVKEDVAEDSYVSESTDSYEESSESEEYYEAPEPVEEPVQEAVDASSDNVSTTATNGESVFKVTAYCSCSKCCGSYSNGQTASGTSCTPGKTIAVDPSIIPIGTTVYINGVPYVAEDTGVSGYRIDIYMSTHVEALNWGVRYCTVTW